MSTETLTPKTTKTAPLKSPTESFTESKLSSRKPSLQNDATIIKASTRHAKTKKSQLTKWLNMSRSQLDSIYIKAKPGDIPHGDTFGTAILAGGPFPQLFAKVANILAWQGKVFDLFPPEFNSGVVINKVSPFGIKLIVAKTYLGESWLDGKETIVIDYSGTSLFAQQIRDEIREVKPGLYLGKVWWGETRILDFALETHKVVSI
jgi:hypothetical protein